MAVPSNQQFPYRRALQVGAGAACFAGCLPNGSSNEARLVAGAFGGTAAFFASARGKTAEQLRGCLALITGASISNRIILWDRKDFTTPFSSTAMAAGLVYWLLSPSKEPPQTIIVVSAEAAPPQTVVVSSPSLFLPAERRIVQEPNPHQGRRFPVGSGTAAQSVVTRQSLPAQIAQRGIVQAPDPHHQGTRFPVG